MYGNADLSSRAMNVFCKQLLTTLNNFSKQHYYKFRGGIPGIICYLKQGPNMQAEFQPEQNQETPLESSKIVH